MGRSYPAYVVRVGKKPGVYVDWNDVTEQITGVPGSSQKGYNSIEEARIVFDQFLREGSVKAVAARFQPSRRLCPGHEEISEEDEDEFFTPSPCKRSLKASTVGALSNASRCGANDSISAPLPPRSRQPVPPLTPPPEAERRGAARGRQRESASASRVKVEVPASSPSVKRYAVAEVQTDLSAVHTTLEIVRTPRRTPRNRSPIRVSSESEDEGTQKVYVKTEPEDSSYVSTPSSRPGRLKAYMGTRSSSPRTSNYDTAPSSVEQQRSSEQRQKGKARQTSKDAGGHIDTRSSSPRIFNYDTAPSSFVRTPASAEGQSYENAPQSPRNSTRRSTRVKTESISTSSSPPTELTQNEDEDPNMTPLHERRRAELNDRRRESERSKAEQPHPSDLQQKGKARQMDEDLDGHESVTSTYQSSAVDDSISARIKTVPRRTRTEPDVSSPTPHAPARLGKSFSMPVPTKSTNYSYKVCSACRQPLSKTSSRVDLLSDAPSCSKCRQPFPSSPCVRSSPRLKRVEQNDEEPGAPTRPSSVCSRQSEDIVNTLGLSVARPESSAASVESDVDPRSPLSRASILRASTLGPSSVLRSPPSTPVGGRRSKIIM